MVPKIKSQISFKEPNDFLVYYETNFSGNTEKISELGFLCDFILMSLMNWSTFSNYSDQIFEQLKKWGQDNLENDLNVIEVSKLTKEKRIEATTEGYGFSYKSKGFKLWGADEEARFYASGAIIALITYLKNKRKEDLYYPEYIKIIMLRCMDLYIEGNLNARHLHRYTSEIMLPLFPEFKETFHT